LIQHLPISIGEFKMLARIGKDKRLFSRDIGPLLPADPRLILRISSFNNEDLDALLVEGILGGDLTRARLERWFAGRHPEAGAAKFRLPKFLYAGLRFSKRPTQADVERLDRLLDDLSQQCNITIVRHKGKPPGLHRWHQQVNGFVRQRVRERVRQVIRMKRPNTGPHNKLAPHGFLEDEIGIDIFSGEDELRSVLSCLACDIEDYDMFVQQALRRHPMPAPDVPDEDQMPEQPFPTSTDLTLSRFSRTMRVPSADRIRETLADE
jgi:hypothetical protein